MLFWTKEGIVPWKKKSRVLDKYIQDFLSNRQKLIGDSSFRMIKESITETMHSSKEITYMDSF